MIYRLLVIIEKAAHNYAAYSPDLPGCVATGATPEESEQSMYEACRSHIRWMLKDGDSAPSGPSLAVYMSVPVLDSQGDEVMQRFLVIIQGEESSYRAYSADSDEELATGATLKEVEQRAYDALLVHLPTILTDEDASYSFPSYAVYMAVPVEVAAPLAA